MILVDKQIKNLCKSINLIDPFKEENLTPDGYDLSVGDTKLPDGYKEHVIIIPPMTQFVVLTEETINMPNDLKAEIKIKSRFGTQGIIGSFGGIEAGFSGKLRLGMFNCSHKEICLFKETDGILDSRIVQIIFHQLCETPEKLYVERSGNYQNVKSL